MKPGEVLLTMGPQLFWASGGSRRHEYVLVATDQHNPHGKAAGAANPVAGCMGGHVVPLRSVASASADVACCCSCREPTADRGAAGGEARGALGQPSASGGIVEMRTLPPGGSRSLCYRVDLSIASPIFLCCCLRILDKVLNYANIMGISTSLGLGDNSFSHHAHAHHGHAAVVHTLVCHAAQGDMGLRAWRGTGCRRAHAVGRAARLAGGQGALSSSSSEGWRILSIAVGAVNLLAALAGSAARSLGDGGRRRGDAPGGVASGGDARAGPAANSNKAFQVAGVVEAVEDVHVGLLCLSATLIVIPSGIITTFSAALVRGFGYAPDVAQHALGRVHPGDAAGHLRHCLLVPTMVGAGLMSHGKSAAGAHLPRRPRRGAAGAHLRPTRPWPCASASPTSCTRRRSAKTGRGARRARWPSSPSAAVGCCGGRGD
ncbi:hypothetical protein TOPH_08524 [Tolypocladium ophioglossoides CBS 100239]|uniref:Uncharacterized protein n=1 Tax=Tolypocladium ophioglossoides (strain CBS 100239) TaxID=1163406 RepID=A0A0L0MYB3_TOLOC|nr:hypothetical protein TOPH_08524 [Tolypocladium ophioglossoides CBS 100239]